MFCCILWQKQEFKKRRYMSYQFQVSISWRLLQLTWKNENIEFKIKSSEYFNNCKIFEIQFVCIKNSSLRTHKISIIISKNRFTLFKPKKKTCSGKITKNFFFFLFLRWLFFLLTKWHCLKIIVNNGSFSFFYCKSYMKKCGWSSVKFYTWTQIIYICALSLSLSLYIYIYIYIYIYKHTHNLYLYIHFINVNMIIRFLTDMHINIVYTYAYIDI